MFNKHLFNIGYAQISTYPPNIRYVDDFMEIQRQARERQSSKPRFEMDK